MASQDSTTPFDPLQAIDLVRAALEPDERKFYKAYLGDEAPGFSDWLAPQGRFRDARQLRSRITDMVVGEAFKQSQAPTVGNAQDMFPGMPMPKEATVMKPGPLLEAEGMDTLQGTQQVQVPSRMQGPMPGVATPLGLTTTDLINNRRDGTPSPISVTDGLAYLGRAEPMYTEGPRPLNTITVGQYGPDQAPSQFQELDRTMKLPPAFQSLLAANIHQNSLQPHTVQPHYPSAEERKYDDAMKFGVAAWMQDHAGQKPSPKDLYMIQQQVTGAFEKAPLPGSHKERLERANADIAGVTAGNASRKQDIDMVKDVAQTKYNDAQTKEILGLFDARLEALKAKAEADRAVGSKESINAFYKEQQLLLNRGKDRIGLAIELRKGGRADDAAYAALINLGLEDLAAGQKAEATNRSWFERTFTDTPAVKVSPTTDGTPQPRLAPPTMPHVTLPPLPDPIMPPAMAPLPEQQSFKSVDEERAYHISQLQTLMRSMAEGEVRVYKGQKFKKEKGDLIKVK